MAHDGIGVAPAEARLGRLGDLRCLGLGDGGPLALRRLLARGAEQAELEQLAAQLLTRHPHIVSISTTRKLRVNFIYPLQGNEALLGLDYSVNPEQMSGVERAIAQRDTVLVGPIRLVQSLNLGIVNRTPVFADEGNGELLGLVSIALSLQDTLQRAGQDPRWARWTAAGMRERREDER